ncbi:hypothetical protein [Metabacillus sp. Hm71]|uniref:hypothetical protein n=1 Tax=Metabacillus sp. Hm71 TaxID=3450743 RepID=UPI003F421B90
MLLDRGEDQKKWLRVGEYDSAFPFVVFSAKKAKQFGFQIPCGSKVRQFGYTGLSCDADFLEVLETVSESKVIGYEKSVTIRRCKKCGQNWGISAKFDSHHGFNALAKRLSSTMNEKSKIAFVSAREAKNQIYVMNADGTNQTRLTNSQGNDTSPAWSPYIRS